jgi:hypothetical protein
LLSGGVDVKKHDHECAGESQQVKIISSRNFNFVSSNWGTDQVSGRYWSWWVRRRKALRRFREHNFTEVLGEANEHVSASLHLGRLDLGKKQYSLISNFAGIKSTTTYFREDLLSPGTCGTFS